MGMVLFCVATTSESMDRGHRALAHGLVITIPERLFRRLPSFLGHDSALPQDRDRKQLRLRRSIHPRRCVDPTGERGCLILVSTLPSFCSLFRLYDETHWALRNTSM
jgi:hypothetical protein